MKPRFTLHDFTQDKPDRGNKVHNQKQGHFSLFRSLLSAEWSRDPVKLSIWIRLLSEATFKARKITFRGQEHHLKPGELVTTSTLIGSRINDNAGKPIDKRSILRILKFFEQEKMIRLTNTHKAMVIFIVNYCAYQCLDGGTLDGTLNGTVNGTLNGTLKPSNDKGLKVVGGTLNGTVNGTLNGTLDGTQNNTDNNTDLKKTLRSGTIKAGSLRGSRSTIRPDAAVQSAGGRLWGTNEDLRLAEWIYGLVIQVDASTKEPNWASWANDIRLIRIAKECDHRSIAIAFKWANSDGFWQTNVLSPLKLRRHWETISLKSQQASKKPNVSSGRNDLDFDNADWAEGLNL